MLLLAFISWLKVMYIYYIYKEKMIQNRLSLENMLND